LNIVMCVGDNFSPGLRLEDFGKESHGEMVIEYLQMKHKCVIAVQDSAVSTRCIFNCLYKKFAKC